MQRVAKSFHVEERRIEHVLAEVKDELFPFYVAALLANSILH